MKQPRWYKDSPLPKGWSERFFGKADLEASYRELEGIRHFYGETMRGAIRSKQLRFEEAWDHFDRSSELVLAAEETIPNLVRQFQLEIYRFYNALYESRVDPDVELPDFSIPTVDPVIFREFPEVRYVLDQRKSSEALLRLHIGQCEEAMGMFRELVADSPDTEPSQLAFYYIALACCEQSLGNTAGALRELENASFATQAIEELLNAVDLSARLVSMYRYFERPQEAEEWKAFLLRLRCPQATKDVFLEKARLLDERCLEHHRPVVF